MESVWSVSKLSTKSVGSRRECSRLPTLFKTVPGSVARSRCSRPSVEGWEPVSSADLHEDTVSFVVQRCAVVVDKITRRLFIKNTQ